MSTTTYVFVEKEEKYQYFLAEKVPYLELCIFCFQVTWAQLFKTYDVVFAKVAWPHGYEF